MKILHINASYKPAFVYGGPTMSVSMLCEQTATAGNEVTIYTTTANGNSELPLVTKGVIVDNVTVYRFKRLTKDHTHFSPALLYKLWWEANTFDIIHIHAWWNLVSVLGCLVALLRGVPVVVSPRGTLSNYSFTTNNTSIKRLMHLLLGRHLLKKCHIHTTSTQEENTLLELVTPKSIFILPNLVKLPLYENTGLNKPSGKLKLIFFSRIEAKKGLDILFNALSKITVPYSLTIAGAGDDDYINHLKQTAIDLDISSYITWAGFRQDDKFALLSQHDLFVLPSYDENFGNSIIESLAVGTPVLISNNTGLKDYVLQNEFGWVCEANITALSDKINEIGFGQQTTLKEIREKAPAIIYRDFSHDNLTKQYLSRYNQIIKNG
ncbi:MAG: XrtY-associated glycosyltransferase XYAG1 [Mucilaginibacter sp.]